MGKRFLILLVVMVLLVLGVTGFLMLRLSQMEDLRVEAAVVSLGRARLEDLLSVQASFFGAAEEDFAPWQELALSAAMEIRRALAASFLVQQALVVDADGALLYPPEADRSAGESAFVAQTAFLYADGVSLAPPAAEDGSTPDRGWRTFFRDNGLQFLYWFRRPDDRYLVLGLSREALLSDFLAALPEGAEDTAEIRMLDESGNVFCRWGRAAQSEAAVAVGLAAPLETWTLEYRNADPAPRATNSLLLLAVFPFSVFGLGLGLIAFLLYRENVREALEARRRISFVNQVSHELKTPLTNLRLYAELLGEHLADQDEKTGRYLGVLGEETQRLSRIIQNVLSFSRRDRPELSEREEAPDELVRKVAASFAPQFERSGMRAELRLDADRTVRFDSDKVEQILVNLLGNVVKYAASGGNVGVDSGFDGSIVWIRVRDSGPGIPRRFRQRVFEPFFRIGHRPDEGSSGTGLGLSISRDLARALGGSLILEKTAAGCSFLLRFPVQEVRA